MDASRQGEQSEQQAERMARERAQGEVAGPEKLAPVPRADGGTLRRATVTPWRAGSADILALQRAAGNRAVLQLLQRRFSPRALQAVSRATPALVQRRGAALEEQELAPPQAPSVRAAAPTGPESALQSRSREFAPDAPESTRPERGFQSTESPVTLEGPGAGAEPEPAAASDAASVTFASSEFNATIPGALKIERDTNHLSLCSLDYRPSGKVTASGPKEALPKWQVGFIQTVYASTRRFHYVASAAPPAATGEAPAAGTPSAETPAEGEPAPAHGPRGLELAEGEQAAAPAAAPGAYTLADTLSEVPVRDATTPAPPAPWYADSSWGGVVSTFDAAETSVRTAFMYDRPSTHGAWGGKRGEQTYKLAKTSGKDAFRSWLAVRHVETKELRYLNWADWEVDYGAGVTVDDAAPQNSTVTPTTGGAKVTGSGEGAGSGRSPVLSGTTANAAAVWQEE